MTLRHMKIFAEVCKNESITKAAETLNMTQPTVSIAIKEIEQHYHVQLFERMNRKLYITEKGKELLQYAQTILTQFELAENQIPFDHQVHTLRIGSNVSFGTNCLPTMIKKAHHEIPNINSKIHIANSEQIEEKLLKNELDFAIVDNLNISSHFISKMIFQETMIPFCGTDYSLSKSSPYHLSDLANEPLLLRELGSGARDTIDQAFSLSGISCVPTMESTSTLALINAAKLNLGIVFLPETMQSDSCIQNKLIPLQLEDNPLIRRYFLIYHKKKYLSNEMKRYMNFFLNL